MTRSGPSGGKLAFGSLAILFGASLIVAGWDGGRRNEKWLADRERSSVTIDPRIVYPAHDGKLIHVTGPISTGDEVYDDPPFGVSARGFALVRLVWEYAYAGGDGGGGDDWYLCRGPSVLGGSPEAADPSRSVIWLPKKDVRIGAFTLDAEIVVRLVREATGVLPESRRDGRAVAPAEQLRGQIERAARRAPTFRDSVADAALPAGWRRGPDGLLYSGPVRSKPAHGDRRVEYRLVVIEPKAVTLLCRQAGDRLAPEPRDRRLPFLPLHLEETGRDAAFESARQAIRREAWIVIVEGISLVAAGLGLIVWGVRAGLRCEARHDTRAEPSAGWGDAYVYLAALVQQAALRHQERRKVARLLTLRIKSNRFTGAGWDL